MTRVFWYGVLGIHLAPKAVCLFYVWLQNPRKNDKFINQFLAPITRPTLLGKIASEIPFDAQ